MDATEAYVGLGSNVGDRIGYLREAVRGLVRHGRIRLVAASPVYASEAHTLDPDEEQPSFFNAVLALRTTLSPRALLYVGQRLERAAGRIRSRPWAPRPLDVDLLSYDALTCRAPDLNVPHPRLHERRFVLQPWADVAPNLYVPSPFENTVRVLLNQCPDATAVVPTAHTLTPALPSG